MVEHAKIAPASWFFSMCYRVTGRVMDKESREKFKMVQPKDVKKILGPLFSADQLPPHLGGHSKLYADEVVILK